METSVLEKKLKNFLEISLVSDFGQNGTYNNTRSSGTFTQEEAEEFFRNIFGDNFGGTYGGTTYGGNTYGNSSGWL